MRSRNDRHALVRAGSMTGRLCLVLALLAGAATSGCLTRQGPEWPYVKAADAVPRIDPIPAQMSARMQELETDLQRLRDSVERLQAAGANGQVIRNLQDRVSAIERQIGIEAANRQELPASASPVAGPVTQDQIPVAPPSAPAPRAAVQPIGPSPAADDGAPLEIRNAPIDPDERAYRDAYAQFRNGALDQAGAMFEDFLKKHPKSRYAADAVYWVAETRFNQGRYDEAVLQYDRVLKDFPGSKKELNALLKQGQAFEKMGDPRSARIIFQKIVSEFPHTAQGRQAASRLKNTPENARN